MSQTPPTSPVDSSLEEISLEEVDKILAEQDPEFTSALVEIRSVGPESEVEIESAVPGDELSTEAEESKELPKRRIFVFFPKLEQAIQPLYRIKPWLFTRWLKFKAQVVIGWRQFLIMARTLPKEFALYIWAMAKAVVGIGFKGAEQFRSLSQLQKTLVLATALLAALAATLLKFNLSGVWLPQWNQPLLTNFADVAERTFEFDPQADTEPFLRAFPQEENGYLFRKMVINLKRTNSVRNPMGAFEFYVLMDSQDAALEAQARERELHDRLQRSLEELSYPELDSRIGKHRVKDVVRRTLNDVLTQGWVKDVYIKVMILKP